MFTEKFNSEERGQVGIGTLIVFIALVLVAAIAAGVLINTAGFLQSQAEQTGQESTAQTANNVQVVSVNGTATTGDPGSVDTMSAKFQLAPGSEPIDLDAGTLEVFVEGSVVSEITVSAGILDDGETVDVALSGVTVNAGDDMTIIYTTPDGSQTETTVTAPEPITTDGDIRL